MNNEKFKRQRRFMLVLPLLTLPFVTLAFWALGGGLCNGAGQARICPKAHDPQYS